MTTSHRTYYDLKDKTYNEIELGYEAFEMLDSKERECFDYKEHSRDECILNHIEKGWEYLSFFKYFIFYLLSIMIIDHLNHIE